MSHNLIETIKSGKRIVALWKTDDEGGRNSEILQADRVKYQSSAALPLARECSSLDRFVMS